MNGGHCIWEDCDQTAIYCEGHAHELANPLGIDLPAAMARHARNTAEQQRVLRFFSDVREAQRRANTSRAPARVGNHQVSGVALYAHPEPEPDHGTAER